MELNHLTALFTVTLSGNIRDSHALFGVRGAFEEAFREAVGCRRGECRGCRRLGECFFSTAFGQELSRDPEAVRRHQKPPLPFVFRMPVLPPPPNKGRSAECALTLFGGAIQHLDAYVAAVSLLFARVGGAVAQVELLSPGGGRSPLPADAAATENPLPLLSAADPLDAGPLAPERVTLEFVTPLRLVHDGKVLREVAFSHIARSLLRRASAIACYYGGVELPFDYRALAAASEKVACARSTARFAPWGRSSGIVGSFTFSGDLEPFHLLLVLGRVMHLGKGASFGLGEFRLS